MRLSLSAVVLCSSIACLAPSLEPDASTPFDAGLDPAVDAGLEDAGTPVEDAGREPLFAQVASLPARPRALWAQDAQRVWLVGDRNAIFRRGSTGWVNVAPPAGEGIDWREVRGDDAFTWAVGEKPDAGSFIFRSRTNDVWPIDAEGSQVHSPHLLSATTLDGVWVAGEADGLAAVLISPDQGERWVAFEVPGCSSIVGGWSYAFQDNGVERHTMPEALCADSRLGYGRVVDRSLLWEVTAPLATQPVTGPAFVYGPLGMFEGVLAGERALLRWTGARTANPPLFPTRTILDGFAAVGLWGFSELHVWAIREDEIVFRDGSPVWTWEKVPGEAFVAIHGTSTDVWVVSADGDVFHRAR